MLRPFLLCSSFVCLMSATLMLYAKETGGGSTKGTLAFGSRACLCTDTVDACFARGNGNSMTTVSWIVGANTIVGKTDRIVQRGAQNGYQAAVYQTATGIVGGIDLFLGNEILNAAAARSGLVCTNPIITFPIVTP